MRTRVKVCGITREQDALAAAQLGADALGFILWRPSERYVDPERAGRIASRLPAFVVPVCVFVNPSREEVEAAIGQLPAATLQFHGEEPAEFCGRFGRPHAGAAAWLIDAFDERMVGGTGIPFDWSLLPGALARPWILSGGLTAVNVTQAVQRLRPWGVDVSSGVETQKGIKDAGRIAAFISGVRNADG